MKIILCLLIMVLSSVLRLYRLSSIPPSPSLDEVSIGYNAYSLFITGRDEYGYRLPLLLRAYDDWRPAGYVYTVMPAVLAFGLNSVAIRLPAAIMGIMSVFMIYILASDIYTLAMKRLNSVSFKSDKEKEINQKAHQVGILSSLFMAISPWAVYISRMGHEVNLGFFLTLIFIVAFTRFIRSKKIVWIYITAVAFSLSFNSYQSQKIFMPLLAVGLLYFFRSVIDFRIKVFFKPLLIGIVLLVPMVYLVFRPESLARYSATGILENDARLIKAQEIYHQARLNGDYWQALKNHRIIVSVIIITNNYFKHINPRWLFSGNIKEDHKVPYLGLLYQIDLLFLILGFIWLWKNNRKYLLLILYIYAISILPGGLTTQAPHAMRTMQSLIALALFFGMSVGWWEKGILKKFVRFGLLVPVFYAGLNIPALRTGYLIDFPRFHARSFQTALQNALPRVIRIADHYDRIIISNQDNLYQSYMFYLFVNKYDPRKYQLAGGTGSGGYDQTHTLGKFQFRPIDWKNDRNLKETLFLGNKDDFVGSVNIIDKYDYPDGSSGVWIIQS
ncbi:hypothetical protein A2154_01520 [Candidatus Gottesmanbacteria bacterium RBG_16_43_7]|uniref:Glycosyltransferase RgtA/B/C/D-like domain-containing protein n=1 Tax=Candidatus Gottesmanbacteria bacterium RBG_16_43_7 TaxID=1798373 RepID=A0A1F5Z7C3_9BACT|nr:MAG: hypothetical protein A2154_01520 [Candidatus Gottesmanbacteria bacterium RBG_16_43_7]